MTGLRKTLRAAIPKLRTNMDTFPGICLFSLAVVTGLSLASELQLTTKLFILAYSAVVTSLTFIIYKFYFKEEK
jgi:hypothetical protein